MDFFSGSYFPIFGLNTGKYGLEKTPYLDTFYAVLTGIYVFYLQRKVTVDYKFHTKATILSLLSSKVFANEYSLFSVMMNLTAAANSFNNDSIKINYCSLQWKMTSTLILPNNVNILCPVKNFKKNVYIFFLLKYYQKILSSFLTNQTFFYKRNLKLRVQSNSNI